MLNFIACFIFLSANAQAASVTEEQLRNQLAEVLQKTIPLARIQLPSLQKVVQQAPISTLSEISRVRLVEDRPNGVAIFEISGSTPEGESVVQNLQSPYEAWVDVPVATRRIYPNSKIKSDDYNIRPVNVASGMPREYRGVMLTQTQGLDRMESRQTILEGHYFTRNAIQRQPDLRRGEMVKLELVSGDLSLVTQAVVQEPASVGERVRVLTLKTKKELSGELKENHVVEVKL